MANGWESKSVEMQQADRQAGQQATEHTDKAEQKAQQVAASAPKPVQPNSRVEEAEHKRKLQDLHLQRERILSERTSNPHRRTALTNALADIEEKLAELGWTIHL
jgi:hypothetical protein